MKAASAADVVCTSACEVREKREEEEEEDEVVV